MGTSTFRSRQRVDGRPAFTESGPNGAATKAECSFPLRHVHRLTVERQMLRAAGVIHLRCGDGPTTVVRTVRAIRVDPIDRMQFGWALAHVREKGREVVQPAIAHTNAATAVIVPADESWIRAARADVAPALVLRCQASVPCGTVRRESCAGDFGIPTAARSRNAVSQGGAVNDFLAATVTATAPFRHSAEARPRESRQHQPSAKFQAGQIDQWLHRQMIPNSLCFSQ